MHATQGGPIFWWKRDGLRRGVSSTGNVCINMCCGRICLQASRLELIQESSLGISSGEWTGSITCQIRRHWSLGFFSCAFFFLHVSQYRPQAIKWSCTPAYCIEHIVKVSLTFTGGVRDKDKVEVYHWISFPALCMVLPLTKDRAKLWLSRLIQPRLTTYAKSAAKIWLN